jgi:hypothetical protein
MALTERLRQGRRAVDVENGRLDPHGYAAGKKAKSKKRAYSRRQIRPPAPVVHRADIRDGDAGILVKATLFGLFLFLQKLFADGGYQGPQVPTTLEKTLPHLNVEIVKRSLAAAGVKGAPQRCRTHRRLDAAGLPRIGRISTARRRRSSTRPIAAACTLTLTLQPTPA